MKKIVILIFFLSFVSNAQNNMQFNRVIDTIITVDVIESTNLLQNILGGSVSPPNGKVWKVNNILLIPQKLGDYVKYCDTGDTYTNQGSEVKLGLLFSDGVNEHCLCLIGMLGYVDPYDDSYSSPNTSPSNCTNTYPLWLNNQSTLTSFLSWGSTVGLTNNTRCLESTTGKVRVSAIEFNLVE